MKVKYVCERCGKEHADKQMCVDHEATCKYPYLQLAVVLCTFLPQTYEDISFEIFVGEATSKSDGFATSWITPNDGFADEFNYATGYRRLVAGLLGVVERHDDPDFEGKDACFVAYILNEGAEDQTYWKKQILEFLKDDYERNYRQGFLNLKKAYDELDHSK